MDRIPEFRSRMRRTKLRTAIFFRKNGLYIAALACLAVIGLTAAILFVGRNNKPSPVAHSDDETLSEASKSTPSPSPTQTPVPRVSNEPSVSPTRPVLTAPPATRDPSATAVPDFTPLPEPTADSTLSKLEPPVDGRVIRVFAMNSLIYSETLKQWMTHPGVDISAKKGDPVYAVLAGVVENVYTDDMLGVTVVLKHENGLTSIYSSLKEAPPVEIGASVASRQIVGYIGDTAISECAEVSHLHFELYYGGAAIDPESLMIFDKD